MSKNHPFKPDLQRDDALLGRRRGYSKGVSEARRFQNHLGWTHANEMVVDFNGVESYPPRFIEGFIEAVGAPALDRGSHIHIRFLNAETQVAEDIRKLAGQHGIRASFSTS